MASNIRCYPLLLLMSWPMFFLISCSAVAAMKTSNYSDALDKSLMFFEAQRSGKLSSSPRTNWRGNSGLRDGFEQEVDLVGGYYDAGDNVKFGLPMAYSVTMLSWAAVDFKTEILAAYQMENTLQAIKWGTDYFIKAHSESNVLWAQVGDGESDHCCWERAEDMSTPRTAYRIDQNHPGSDLAGETAAALAAASLAFQPYNSSYSSILLGHAKQLFGFADNFRGQYDDSITEAEAFYPSSGYSDELLWAAAWLYRATNNDYYLQYAVDNAADLGGTGNAVRMFSWDNKYAGLQILLSKVLLDGDGASYASTLTQYKTKADYFACAYLQKNNGFNVPMTPGGLAYLLPSNNLQYVASASFLLAVYSDYLASTNSVADCTDGHVQPQHLLNFAKSQADYILGHNPDSMSYLIGYGTKYPCKSHHRGSSIPSIQTLHARIGCVQGFEAWYQNPGENPNVLYGALVGGPDSSDSFSDDRNNYDQNEPTTSAAAPLIGLFSKLQSVYSSSSSTGYRPLIQRPKSPTPQESPTKPLETSPTNQLVVSTPKSSALTKQPTTATATATAATTEVPAKNQTAASPLKKTEAHDDLPRAPSPPSHSQPQKSPAQSSERADYVYTQSLESSEAATHQYSLAFTVLLLLFVMPALAAL